MLILITTYFSVFYFKLLGLDKSIAKSLMLNDIQATLGINLSLLIMYICLERYVYSRFSLLWIENTDSLSD